jgi:two-component system response regulator RegX3
MGTGDMHHILVVDDDPTNTKLLKFLLTDEGYEVTTALSATEALRCMETNGYDMILLDIMMPEMDGLELCQQIRTTSHTPIIFITALGETQDKIAGLRAGGDDYISKPYDPSEVVARVWAVLRRSGPVANSESSLKTADFTLDPVDNKVTLARNGKTVSLTPIEARLLRFLVSNPGRSQTRNTLLIKVWGYSYEGESNILDVYIKRLRRKIEDDPRNPTLLLTLRGVGYKYQPADARAHGVTGG